MQARGGRFPPNCGSQYGEKIMAAAKIGQSRKCAPGALLSARSRIGVHATTLLLAVCAGFGIVSSHAQIVSAAIGCPQFHCTPEATGVMSQPIIGSASLATHITRSGPSLGTLYAQGCSGNGKLLACLVDPPPGKLGTLKILDTRARPTMRVVASDAWFFPSMPLEGSWSHGQAPFMFSDGRIGAGDANSYKIYNFAKANRTVTSVALPPAPQGARTMGLTDLANGYGVVTRTDGVLTFINMEQGTAIGSLSLTGLDGEPITLSSPPSASNGVLYVVANGDAGYLYAVSMAGNAAPSTWNWRYTYSGKTGASPVEATPAATGYSKTLILLDVPGTSPDTPQLQGIIDNGSSATLQWFSPLAEDLAVAPSVDGGHHMLYLTYKDDYRVFGYPLYVAGTPPVLNEMSTSYDLQALTGLSWVQLNGHIGAIQTKATGDFTLLLAAQASSDGASSNSEYMIVLRPTPAPGSAWSTLISQDAARYTAAWNLSPSSTRGVYCPVVVEGGPTTTQNPSPNGAVLMCDH